MSASMVAGVGLAATIAPGTLPMHAQGRWEIREVRATFQLPLGGVVVAVDMAVLPDGGFVVVDDTLQRAQRFDAAGEAVAGYGGAPGETAAMEGPLGVAVDVQRRRVYVADAIGRRALAFDLDGALVAAWDGFSQPEAATVGLDGRLYVYDRLKAALAVRRPDGTAEPDITVQRALSFDAVLPIGLATSRRGSLFFAAENPVANAANVLYEFTADGTVVPPRTLLTWRIRDIAFDAAGEMFLLDWTNGRIVSRLDRQTGAIGRTWPVEGHPVAMAARAADEVWLLYAASPTRPAAVVVLQGGREVRRMRLPRPTSRWFAPPLRLQVDRRGNVWIVDELARATRFDFDLQADSGNVQFTLHGLQEVVPLADGAEVMVFRTRSSSSADDPDDADAPPPGIRRAHRERYALRPGDDAGVALPALSSAQTESNVTAGDASVFAASAPDATGTGAWVLDIGRGELQHVVRADPGPDTIAAVRPRTAVAPEGFRDVITMGTDRVGLLHPPTAQLLVVDGAGEVTDSVNLDVDGTPRRIARLPDGRLAVLTSADAVAILNARGQRQDVVALPRPNGANDELAADIAAGPNGILYVADRLDRTIYGLFERPDVPGPRTLFLPWNGIPLAR